MKAPINTTRVESIRPIAVNCFFERHKIFALAISFGIGLLVCLLLASKKNKDRHSKVNSFENLPPAGAMNTDWLTLPNDFDEHLNGSVEAIPTGARRSNTQPEFFPFLNRCSHFEAAWKKLTELGVRLQI